MENRESIGMTSEEIEREHVALAESELDSLAGHAMAIGTSPDAIALLVGQIAAASPALRAVARAACLALDAGSDPGAVIKIVRVQAPEPDVQVSKDGEDA